MKILKKGEKWNKKFFLQSPSIFYHRTIDNMHKIKHHSCIKPSSLLLGLGSFGLILLPVSEHANITMAYELFGM